jgi:cytidylate kinase
MSMTKQERERVVLELYHNQGKTVREIAKEARMSFRNIGSILNKVQERKEQQQDMDDNVSDKNHQQEQHLSLSTQAYKLFSEGKAPIEVAVALNQRVRDNQILQRVLQAKPNA